MNQSTVTHEPFGFGDHGSGVNILHLERKGSSNAMASLHCVDSSNDIKGFLGINFTNILVVVNDHNGASCAITHHDSQVELEVLALVVDHNVNLDEIISSLDGFTCLHNVIILTFFNLFVP